jgi:hypothetical protein
VGYVRERGGNQQELGVAQSQVAGRRAEEVNRHQQEAEERVPNRQPQLMFDGVGSIFYQNSQEGDRGDGTVAIHDERSALLGTEIIAPGSKQILNSTAGLQPPNFYKLPLLIPYFVISSVGWDTLFSSACRWQGCSNHLAVRLQRSPTSTSGNCKHAI